MTQYDQNDFNRRKFSLGQLGSGLGAGILGLGGYQQPPRGWHPQIQQPINQQDPWGIKPMGEQITGFGETLGGYGEQIGGFESTLGGYGEKLGGFESSLGGFGQQMTGFGEQMGGFGEQMGTINEKLSSMQEGIASLTEQFGTMQQQNQPQQNFNPYASLFGGGMFSPYGGLGGLFGRYR